MMSREILDSALELFNQKNIEKALEQFEQCASDAACQPEAYYGMACCYSYLYDIYNAKDCFEKVVGIAPGTPEAEVARNFIENSKKWISGEIDFFTLSSEIRKAPEGSLCAYHEEGKVPAVYVCFSCDKPICLQCTFPVSAKYYCVECGRVKEIEERKKGSFKKHAKEADPVHEEKPAVRESKKIALHAGLYAALLCASLLYRFALRDLAVKNAGLDVVHVHGEIMEEAVNPAMPDAEKPGFAYAMKISVKNSGDRIVNRIRFRIKLYDTFGQKVAEKDAGIDRIYKKRPFLLKPGKTRSVEIKVKGLRRSVRITKVRVLSFQVQED